MSALPSSVYANTTTPCFELAGAFIPVPLTLTPAGPTVVPANDSVTFTVTPAYPIEAGAEYDVQLIGYWETAGGSITVSSGDYVEVLVQFGIEGGEPEFGLETLDSLIYPDAIPVWGANEKFPFSLRKRVVCGATLSNLSVSASFFAASTYPAVSVEITRLDIVRVA